MILIISHVKMVFPPMIWSILANVPSAFEKNVYSFLGGEIFYKCHSYVEFQKQNKRSKILKNDREIRHEQTLNC